MFSLDTYRSLEGTWANHTVWYDEIAQFQIDFPDAKEYVFQRGDFVLFESDHVRVANMQDYVVKTEYTICQRVLIAIVCIFKRIYYRLKCEDCKMIHTSLDNMGSVALTNRFTRTTSILIKQKKKCEEIPGLNGSVIEGHEVFGTKMLKELNDKIQPRGWLIWSSNNKKNVEVDFKTFWNSPYHLNSIRSQVRELIEKESKNS